MPTANTITLQYFNRPDITQPTTEVVCVFNTTNPFNNNEPYSVANTVTVNVPEPITTAALVAAVQALFPSAVVNVKPAPTP